MIAHTTGTITAGSPLDHPLIEHNPDRHIRPIFVKIRKVKGKTGWLLRRIGHLLGAPDPTPEGLGHHAVQIGAYVYELTREHEMIGQRLTGSEIWPSTVGEMCVGWTDLTDEDMQIMSVKVQAWSRNRHGGKYDIRRNNCQDFIRELLRRIAALSSITDSETTSLQSDSTASASTIELREMEEVCPRVTTLTVPVRLRDSDQKTCLKVTTVSMAASA